MIFISISLAVHNLSVSYDTTSVVNSASFSVGGGQLVGIIGPNGAGKSSLMGAMLGLIKPSSGQVQFGTVPLSQARHRISYVKQKADHDLTFPIRVKDVVMMGLYHQQGFFKWATKAHKQQVLHALEQVDMAAYANTQIAKLSGGQLQRVFMARVLLQNPDYVFLDEPFAAIDASSEQQLMVLLRRMRDQGKLIVMVHHDLKQVDQYFDQVILLNKRVYAAGDTHTTFTKENLLSTYNDPLLDLLSGTATKTATPTLQLLGGVS